MECGSPKETLTERRVRESFRKGIEHSLENGENPYSLAATSDLHHPFGLNGLPEPETEEQQNSSRNKEALLAWIMETDEMRQALVMFSGQTPGNPDRENGIEAREAEEGEPSDLTSLIAGIAETEADWQ